MPPPPPPAPAPAPASAGPRRAPAWSVGVAATLLILLLGVIAWPTPTAQARQVGEGLASPTGVASFRAPGRYRAVSGEIGSGSSDAIWILDEVNEELLAVRWNDSRKQLETLGYRDLRADADRRPSR